MSLTRSRRSASFEDDARAFARSRARELCAYEITGDLIYSGGISEHALPDHPATPLVYRLPLAFHGFNWRHEPVRLSLINEVIETPGTDRSAAEKWKALFAIELVHVAETQRRLRRRGLKS